MIRIALCDDEPAELDKLECMLASYSSQRMGCSFSVERFLGADEMLRQISEGGYMPDLLLLDIYMQGRLGTEVARELRGMGKNFGICFLTSSKEHALEAFRVNAVQYLVKPILDGDLFPVLDQFIQDMGRQKRYLLLKDCGYKRVELHDIVYCEARKKRQCIYLTDGAELLQNQTMGKIYERLSICREFVKVGVSYIINLDHIDRLNAQEAQMDNGDIIYLPRGSYSDLREQYFDYYCGEEGDR